MRSRQNRGESTNRNLSATTAQQKPRRKKPIARQQAKLPSKSLVRRRPQKQTRQARKLRKNYRQALALAKPIGKIAFRIPIRELLGLPRDASEPFEERFGWETRTGLAGYELARGRDRHLPSHDLRNHNLRGAFLAETDFTSVVVAGADLSGSILFRSIFRGKDLRGTKLVGADLSQCDLREACLEGCDLRDVALQDADLRGANLRNANLTGADLMAARLERTDFQPVDLAKTDLGKNLPGADLRGANLTGADLSGANLRQTLYDNRTVWPRGLPPWVACNADEPTSESDSGL